MYFFYFMLVIGQLFVMICHCNLSDFFAVVVLLLNILMRAQLVLAERV